jgi:hypothetical protein
MKKRLLWASLLVIVLGLMWIPSLRGVLGTESSFASNYDHVYAFNVQSGYYGFSHKLYTFVPSSLYDYYHGETHSLSYDDDYSKFVTPSAFESIADNIRNVTRDMPYSDEQFANAVLMLVHQVSYVKSDVKYPVETIVDNSGDCKVLSLLAASIMKAGGLDVVLFYYKGLSPSHINVGVYLPYTPFYHTWWMTPTGYEYNNKTYWMAECTSLADWKVGDQPSLLAGATPEIISLENCEESSPAHVSSSLDSPLVPSSISINLSTENSSVGNGEQTLTVSGSISPAYSGKSVVMYVNQNGYPCNISRTVTDDLGNYSLTWNFTSTGTYQIRTSWSGASNYTGADSETLTVFVGSYSYPQSGGDETSGYYWGPGTGDASASAFAAYPVNQIVRKQEFLNSNLTGKDVVVSGEFVVLGTGQNTTMQNSNITITIPRTEYTVRLPGSRQWITVTRPEQNITVPGPQPINNQFGFILQHNGEDNYTASVRVLNDNDLSQITKQLDGNNASFIDASMITRANTWYKVMARISEDEITAKLYDENGTLLKSIVARNDAMSINESGIMMRYDANAVVAFKNLTAETIDQLTPTPAPPVEDNQVPTNALGLLAPYVGLTMLLVVAVATIAYVMKRKRVADDEQLKRISRPSNLRHLRGW